MKGLAEKVKSLRILLLSKTVIRRLMKMVGKPVTHKVVKIIEKTEGNPA